MHSKGVTLIELMVAIAILAILSMLALPSFQRSIERNRIVGAAENLLADLRYAQTESVKRNLATALTFGAVGANWAYTVNSAPVKTNTAADYQNIAISPHADNTAANGAAANTITFEPKRSNALINGNPIAANARLFSVTSANFNITVQAASPTTLRLCTADGTGGYGTCAP